MTRRNFVKNVSLTTLALNSITLNSFVKSNNIPIRAITGGNKFHWFGYYDKWQFDPTDQYVLSNQVNFEHRTPNADDTIKVGMIDIKNNDEWIELGESHSWGWQQGCMLQWIPGQEQKVIWNDRQDGQFVSHIFDIKTNKKTTLPKPVYALSQDGKWAIGADFARIQNMRPGYGYKGVKDPFEDIKAPKDSGIYKMNLETGTSKLIIRLSDLSKIPYQENNIEDKWHYVNHLLVSPDSERFIFLHRWRENKSGHHGGGFTTRMFTADKNGKDLYILDPSGYTSHFIWKDPKHITAWTKPIGKEHGFYEFEDKTQNIVQIGKDVMTVNGHNTYLPNTNNNWILNDTYPQGEKREQIPYVYHQPTNKRIELGRFHLPPVYKGEWRCDTHPRYSRNGRLVCIDSPHGMNGRQLYLMDINNIIG